MHVNDGSILFITYVGIRGSKSEVDIRAANDQPDILGKFGRDMCQRQSRMFGKYPPDEVDQKSGSMPWREKSPQQRKISVLGREGVPPVSQEDMGIQPRWGMSHLLHETQSSCNILEPKNAGNRNSPLRSRKY